MNADKVLAVSESGGKFSMSEVTKQADGSYHDEQGNTVETLCVCFISLDCAVAVATKRFDRNKILILLLVVIGVMRIITFSIKRALRSKTPMAILSACQKGLQLLVSQSRSNVHLRRSLHTIVVCVVFIKSLTSNMACW